MAPPPRAARRAAAPSIIPHPSPAERAACGRAARAESPRSQAGVHEPAPDRPDPVELLEQQSATRVPELVPIRYGRMLVSPFTFYRGAARIMASDLARGPRTGLTVQACGDAHLSNFGVFASRERRLVFDINDFDETLPGPWEWDVKRLAASMLIGARDNGFSTADQEGIVLGTAAHYRTSMARYAAMKNLDVWYAHTEITALAERVSDEIGRTGRRNLKRNIGRARRRDSLHAFSKLTHEAGGTRRFVSDLPLLVPLEEFVGPSVHRNAGERVVAGQRITQATGDIFLGWMRVKQTIDGGSRDYYVRQLRDWKGSVVVEAMRPRGMAAYGKVCGATLARAHARSGDRVAIAAYLGSGTAFDRAILRFSEAYAEQNERDYAALVEAVRSGRVTAQTEV